MKLGSCARKGFLIFIGIGCILLIISISIQFYNIPDNLRMIPGQKMALYVNYPLWFQPNFENQKAAQSPALTRKLVLCSKSIRKYQVQLKLFGRIPIKKLQVEVAQPIRVVPGGQAIGVVVSTRGLVITQLSPVTGINRKRYFPAREAGLKVGDILLAINRIPINHQEEVELFLRNFNPRHPYLELSIQRQKHWKQVNIRPILTNGGEGARFRLGIFVESPAAGVGTLSFYDPASLRFAGLGHQIARVGGKNGIFFHQGQIVSASIHGIRKGKPGKPGEKIGVFQGFQAPLGYIARNTQFGIYGTLSSHCDFRDEPVPAAFNSQINVGNAEILTVVRGCAVERYKVRIIKVFRQHSPHDKGLILKVVDPDLLRETGGIIQGMSGSPIIQNGRLVGVVTHVFVNDPTKGYGILAEWMLRELYGQSRGMAKAS